MTPPLRIAGLHPILDADWLENNASPAIRAACQPEAVARHLATLPIPLIQLRAKGDPARALAFMTRWLEALRRHAPGVRVILNDRVEWVESLGADGVHVGQGDTPIPECRKHLGRGRILGLSTHTAEEIRQAEAFGVDYVGFGPVFVTATKSDTHAVQGVATLTAIAAQTRLPVVAIGGITLERLSEVIPCGVASAAMISALWQEDWAWRLSAACRLWSDSARS
ncbi:MAG: thiamine phosphate synthase [Magnetococcales bacterium]|nr:thiamine phosphate synthase [Magnetococcales bacterium]